MQADAFLGCKPCGRTAAVVGQHSETASEVSKTRSKRMRTAYYLSFDACFVTLNLTQCYWYYLEDLIDPACEGAPGLECSNDQVQNFVSE